MYYPCVMVVIWLAIFWIVCLLLAI